MTSRIGSHKRSNILPETMARREHPFPRIFYMNLAITRQCFLLDLNRSDLASAVLFETGCSVFFPWPCESPFPLPRSLPNKGQYHDLQTGVTAARSSCSTFTVKEFVQLPRFLQFCKSVFSAVNCLSRVRKRLRYVTT